MPWTVEAVRPSDLPAVLALLAHVQLPVTGVAEQFPDYMAVRDEDRLIGVCGLEVHGDDALLRGVAVDPQYRGFGVAGALVEQALRRARERGLREVYLLTTTAQEYFRQRGFAACTREEAPEAIRTSWEFRVGCPDTSALMKRATASSAQ